MLLTDQLNRFFKPLIVRVRGMVVRGVIKLVTDTYKIQKIQASLLAGELKDGLEHYQGYGITSNPPVGMEILTVFCGGDRSNGVVVAVGDRKFRLKGLQSGEVALYTDEGDYLKFARGHVIQISTLNLQINAVDNVNISTKQFNIKSEKFDINSKQVNINSNQVDIDAKQIKASKDITAAGDIKDKTGTMQQIRDTYNIHKHLVTGVPSNTPDTPM